MSFTIPNAADVLDLRQAGWDQVHTGLVPSAMDGIGWVSGCEVTPAVTPDMTVSVSAGAVVRAGVQVSLPAVTLAVAAAHATHPRFDLVVGDAAAFTLLPGIPTSPFPVFPDPGSDPVLWSVWVPPAETAITTRHLLGDCRVKAIVGTSAILDDSVVLPAAGAGNINQGTPADTGKTFMGLKVWRRTFRGFAPLNDNSTAVLFSIGTGVLLDSGGFFSVIGQQHMYVGPETPTGQPTFYRNTGSTGQVLLKNSSAGGAFNGQEYAIWLEYTDSFNP